MKKNEFSFHRLLKSSDLLLFFFFNQGKKSEITSIYGRRTNFKKSGEKTDLPFHQPTLINKLSFLKSSSTTTTTTPPPTTTTTASSTTTTSTTTNNEQK